MPEYNDQELSVLIYSTLDDFGFKKHNILLQSQWINDQIEMGDRIVGLTLGDIPAGSTAEGITVTNSDYDVMHVLEDVVCVDKGFAERNVIVLETDYTNTAPGYTKVISFSVPDTVTLSWLFNNLSSCRSVSTKTYISSGKINQLILQNYNDSVYQEFDLCINGPAVTFLKSFPLRCDTDIVFSIYFYGSKFTERWTERHTLYPWPTIETVKKVSEMEGYIVPVGDKQSDSQSLEWRICYTTAEKELILNLSDTQLKMYVILKMMSKEILKPVCKALTSYVIKNVVFWVAERSHPRLFAIENLVNAIQNALNFIKHCIQSNHLPNYMIPERNLLRGAVCGQGKVKVLNFLSKCLEEGGVIILRIPKLYTCISFRVTHPDNVIMFGKWRDSVQRAINVYAGKVFADLMLKLRADIKYISATEFINKCTVLQSDDIQMKYKPSLIHIVLPDIFALLSSGMSLEDIKKVFKERVDLVDIL